MKTGWLRSGTRKDRLETIALRIRDMTYSQSAIAWQKLANKMLELSDPCGPATPKFNDLLMAIVAATVRCDERATMIGWVPEEVPATYADSGIVPLKPSDFPEGWLKPFQCPKCGTPAIFVRDRNFADGSGRVYTCRNDQCENRHLYFYEHDSSTNQPAGY